MRLSDLIDTIGRDVYDGVSTTSDFSQAINMAEELEELVLDLWDRLCDKDEICDHDCRVCEHEAWNYESPNCVYNRRMRELGLVVD